MPDHSPRGVNQRNRRCVRWLRDEKGAALIEFAVAFPVFILFFLGILEIALINFGNSIIENMMNQTARLAIVGCQRNEFTGGACNPDYAVDPAFIKRQIVEKSYGLVDACDPSKFGLSVSVINTAYNFDNPNSNIIDLGQGDEIVVYYASYKWPVFTPSGYIQELFGDTYEYEYATVVRNERFGVMGADRVRPNTGC